MRKAQVTPSIIALIVLILFLIYLGIQFLLGILELFINGVLLYVIFLRAYTELVKEKKYNPYIAGAAIAMITYLILGNILSKILVWGPVTYIFEAFVFAQIVYYFHKKYKRKRRKR